MLAVMYEVVRENGFDVIEMRYYRIIDLKIYACVQNLA